MFEIKTGQKCRFGHFLGNFDQKNCVFSARAPIKNLVYIGAFSTFFCFGFYICGLEEFDDENENLIIGNRSHGIHIINKTTGIKFYSRRFKTHDRIYS